ncbi:hypothetical protein NECAME_03025 [Necator americanus]|uniref:39S ribosomal protein L49, mitochondrial n=1 Tax=Necator americanus TaxID=51031 RepID=W2T7M0_NECAM|nr:hypothetical protein NECAME_03025 [Necator americanus]ETN77853.1 hypothetical protein NECAME_03025 [Necator americanus]
MMTRPSHGSIRGITQFQRLTTLVASTTTSFEEIIIDWSYVERLMPYDVVPPLPKHDSYPTPSGWQPPQGKF